MSEIKVLLAGESWMSTTTHVKGFNQFWTSEYQIGIEGLDGVRTAKGAVADMASRTACDLGDLGGL